MKSVNYLNRTRIRQFDENVDNDIKKFESDMNIALPPIFKLFYQTFDMQSNWSPVPVQYLNPKFNKKSSLPIDIIYRPNPTSMPPPEYVMDFKIMKSAYENYSEEGLESRKLLPIVKLDNSMIVTLGFGKDNMDKIMLLNTEGDQDQKVIFLSENIFEYFRGLDIKESEYFPISSKLYLNWNEDFWRVKEEDNPL